MASALRLALLLLVAAGAFLPEWLPRPPASGHRELKRALSLSPAETQNMDYLGLVDRIIGVSPFDEHPAVQHLPKLAGINASDEDILRLNPDIILVSETSEFDRMKRQGILVHSSMTGDLNAVYSNLLALERIFGISSSRAEVFRQKTLRPKAPRIGSYVIAIGIDPLYSVSTNNFLSQVMELAGWENAVRTEPAYPVLTDENLSGLRAEVLFAPVQLAAETNALEKIRLKIGARKTIILSNYQLFLPSPFLLDEIETLKNIQ